MVNFMDGFIYVNNGSSFQNEQNLQIIETLINQIREAKEKFSLKSTLFVYTRAEEYKMKINKFSSTISKIINEKFLSQNFINILRQNNIIENLDGALYSKISNSEYKEYQQFKHFSFNTLNINELYDNLSKNYIIFKEEELNQYQPKEEKLNDIIVKIKNIIKINQVNEMVQKVAKLYLFISDNIDKY